MAGDLERFFCQLARNLAASDPTRLQSGLALAEIRNSILPYRANRRALQLESSEEYELVLMRLCAGEGGFARTEPEEVAAEFVAELRSRNPDLTIIPRREKALVSLNPQALAKALEPNPERAYAPRKPGRRASDVKPRKSRETAPERSQGSDKQSQCTRCHGVLPPGRVVNFCPQCGLNLTRTRCPECKAEIEPGWRHCVGCGLPLEGP